MNLRKLTALLALVACFSINIVSAADGNEELSQTELTETAANTPPTLNLQTQRQLASACKQLNIIIDAIQLAQIEHTKNPRKALFKRLRDEIKAVRAAITVNPDQPKLIAQFITFCHEFFSTKQTNTPFIKADVKKIKDVLISFEKWLVISPAMITRNPADPTLQAINSMNRTMRVLMKESFHPTGNVMDHIRYASSWIYENRGKTALTALAVAGGAAGTYWYLTRKNDDPARVKLPAKARKLQRAALKQVEADIATYGKKAKFLELASMYHARLLARLDSAGAGAENENVLDEAAKDLLKNIDHYEREIGKLSRSVSSQTNTNDTNKRDAAFRRSLYKLASERDGQRDLLVQHYNRGILYGLQKCKDIKKKLRNATSVKEIENLSREHSAVSDQLNECSKESEESVYSRELVADLVAKVRNAALFKNAQEVRKTAISYNKGKKEARFDTIMNAVATGEESVNSHEIQCKALLRLLEKVNALETNSNKYKQTVLYTTEIGRNT